MTIIIRADRTPHGCAPENARVRAVRLIVTVATLLTALLGPAAGAAAQTAPAAPAAPRVSGDFGGGALRPLLGSPFAAGNMVIGLTSADGLAVSVTATVVAACASGTFNATASVAADGSFSASGSVAQGTVRMSYTLRGTLSEAPAGTATARFERVAAGRTRRCSATAVAWEARRPGAGFGEPAAVTPGGMLRGSSEQRHGGARRGIVLRISPDGRSVSRAIYGVGLRCTGGRSSPAFDLPRDGLAILPDGRVSDRESGTIRRRRTIVRYVERFAATLGSAGGEGMFSVELSVRDRTTGKRITRCRSGIVRWSASP
jgi:hypothetical protein